MPSAINAIDQALSQQINHMFASSEFLSHQVDLFGDCSLARFLVAAAIVFLWFLPPTKVSKRPSWAWDDKRNPHFSWQGFNFSREAGPAVLDTAFTLDPACTVNPGEPSTHPLTFRYRALSILLAFPPTFLIAKIIQHLVTQSRPIASIPLEVIGDPQKWNALKIGFDTVGSFPSDHAALFFLATTFLWSVNRKLGIFAFVLSLYFCLLRVVYGYHWTSDIIAGAIIGISVALVLLKLEKSLHPKLAFVVKRVEQYPATSYALCFIVLADVANGFDVILEGLVLKLLKDILGFIF